MSSVISKRVNGRTYYYLAESARVDGEPRIVSQRYLGSADDIEAAIEGRGNAPKRSRHLSFGDAAAAWKMLTDIDVVQLVDDIVGRGRAEVSVGTYLALAVLHRIVVPGTQVNLADWWPTTAAERFVRPRVRPAALDQRRFWRAMDRLTERHIERIQAAVSARVRQELGPNCSALVLDVPDFATFVDAGTPAPNGRREKGARHAGLALIATLDGAVPLMSQLYEYDRPGSASFTTLVGRLTDRYRSLSGDDAVTVVIGSGQNAQADLGSGMGLHFVGPLPASACPDLIAAPMRARGARSLEGLPGVSAIDSRTRVSGAERRVILIHSRSLQEAQARGIAQDLGHAKRRLDELAAVLSQGTNRRSREEVAAEVARITYFRWSDRVLSTTLTGTAPTELRLRWNVHETAWSRLHDELFGKQLLVTDRDDWPVAQVITAYRARYRVEGTLKHLGHPLVAAPSTTWRWDRHKITVQALISVVATTVVHLMRRRAQHEGLDLSVRDLLHQLAGVGETVLRYPSTGGRPRTRRLLTDRDATQQRLFDLFQLHRYAPNA